jgi:hypothetical protein
MTGDHGGDRQLTPFVSSALQRLRYEGEYNESSCNDGAFRMLRDDPMLERMTIAATGVASQYQRPHS